MPVFCVLRALKFFCEVSIGKNLKSPEIAVKTPYFSFLFMKQGVGCNPTKESEAKKTTTTNARAFSTGFPLLLFNLV